MSTLLFNSSVSSPVFAFGVFIYLFLPLPPPKPLLTSLMMP